MTLPPSPAAPSPRRNALLDSLNEKFAVFREHAPLALGIHKTLIERMPELNAAQLRLAMRIHTASTRYLKSILTAKERLDLDGKPAGEITEAHREAASAALRERFKKNSERRKAEQKAQQDAQREQEAAQRRQEKLNLLAARFNTR